MPAHTCLATLATFACPYLPAEHACSHQVAGHQEELAVAVARATNHPHRRALLHLLCIKVLSVCVGGGWL